MKKNIFISLVLCSAIVALFTVTSCTDVSAKKTEQKIDAIHDSINNVDTLVMDIDIKYLLGKFNPATDTNFVKISSQYASKQGMYMQKKAYNAFLDMRQSAAVDGINLFIVSATRNFWSQKGIWEAKWNGTRLVEGKNLAQTISDPKQRAITILRYSSMPGTSRHHWGTDIDLNNLNPSYFQSGKGLEIYSWLQQNAGDYGFCQVYTHKNGEGERKVGYEQEDWHWSYFPLSKHYQTNYKAKVGYSDITGFKGAETAKLIDVIPNYVFGINPKILNITID